MILVLARDAGDELLDQVVREAERLGWKGEVSRGDEQIVVTLKGTGDPSGLEDAFRRRGDVDVLPILSRREYRDVRTRRRMLAGLAGGLGVLTAVGAGIPVLGFLLPPKGTLADRTLVRAAQKDEIHEHSAKKVLVLGRPVVLVRMEENRYFALSAICTHMDICQLDWNPERRQLVCPCHGGAFDVYGNVVQGPPSIPLASYPVEEIGSEVFIRGEA
jgi:Rieske Fe-S protein